MLKALFSNSNMGIILMYATICIAPYSTFAADSYDEDFGLSSSDSESSTSAPVPIRILKPTGKISETINSYTQPVVDYDTYVTRTDIELGTTASKGPYQAKILPWMWLKAPDSLGAKPRKTRAYFELKEFWIERTSDSWDLRVGNQIITWGAADQINPTDNWNAHDMTDLFQSTKLPHGTAKLNLHFPSLPDYTLEILVSPFFRENTLPFAYPESGTADLQKIESRWLMPAPSKVSTTDLTAPINYKVAQPTYPKTYQAAARLQFLRVGGWDFSTSYFNGVEKMPRMTFLKQGDASNPSLPITLTLLPSYHRTSIYGLDGAGAFDALKTGFGLRFEIAYTAPDNSRVSTLPQEQRQDLTKVDSIMSVIGIDHTFEKKIYGTVLYMNAMYIHSQDVQSSPFPVGNYTVEGLPTTSPWDKNLVHYTEDRISNKFKFNNVLVYSFVHVDGMDSPSFSYSFSDNLKATAGVDIFFGRKSGFFGQFYDNNRATLSGSYVF